MVHILGQKPAAGPLQADERRVALMQMVQSIQGTIANQGMRDPEGVMQWTEMFTASLQNEIARRQAELDALPNEAAKADYRESHSLDCMAAGVVSFIAQYAMTVAVNANPVAKTPDGLPILNTTDDVRREMTTMYAIAMVHAFANLASDLIAGHNAKKKETRQ